MLMNGTTRECTGNGLIDVEYSRSGTVIKGQERAKPKTRYEEDSKLFRPYVGNILPVEDVDIASFCVCLCLFPQSLSTTTPPSGVHGTIWERDNGVSSVVIR